MHKITKEFETIFNKELGKLLKESREAVNLTQEEVAEATGRKKSSISDNERGVNSTPITVLIAYSELYQVDPDELLKSAYNKAKNTID